MSYEKRDGDLVLFQNTKRDTDKQPTMRGDLLLGGVLYEVAMWTKLDRNGNKFLAGRAQEKNADKTKPPPRSTVTEASLNDSEIPF